MREELNPPKKKNKRRIKILAPKVKKFPGVPDSYFNTLYEIPDVDSIDIRIKEMEERTINLIDSPSPPSP